MWDWIPGAHNRPPDEAGATQRGFLAGEVLAGLIDLNAGMEVDHVALSAFTSDWLIV